MAEISRHAASHEHESVSDEDKVAQTLKVFEKQRCWTHQNCTTVANTVVQYDKSSLELRKAYIEDYLYRKKIAIIIAVFAVIISMSILPGAAIDQFLVLASAIFIAFSYWNIRAKVASLYVIKMAIALKSEIVENPSTESMAEVLGRIRSRPRLDPTKYGLPDSTALIREDRDR